MLNLRNACVKSETLLIAVSRTRVTGSHPNGPRTIRAVGACSEAASIGKVKVTRLVDLPALGLERLGKRVLGNGRILKNTLAYTILATI